MSVDPAQSTGQPDTSSQQPPAAQPHREPLPVYHIHAFRQAVQGRVLDHNGDLGYDYDECVDVPNTWAKWCRQPESYGNARDLDFSSWCRWVENGPTNFPKPGSIVIWKGYPADPQFGHTAVALYGCGVWKLRCVSQNWPDGSACDVRVWRDYEGVAGWWEPFTIQVR